VLELHLVAGGETAIKAFVLIRSSPRLATSVDVRGKRTSSTARSFSGPDLQVAVLRNELRAEWDDD